MAQRQQGGGGASNGHSSSSSGSGGGGGGDSSIAAFYSQGQSEPEVRQRLSATQRPQCPTLNRRFCMLSCSWRARTPTQGRETHGNGSRFVPAPAASSTSIPSPSRTSLTWAWCLSRGRSLGSSQMMPPPEPAVTAWWATTPRARGSRFWLGRIRMILSRTQRTSRPAPTRVNSSEECLPVRRLGRHSKSRRSRGADLRVLLASATATAAAAAAAAVAVAVATAASRLSIPRARASLRCDKGSLQHSAPNAPH